MQDLAIKLVAYVENKLDPEGEMAIDDLIVRYVDDKLDADVTAEIERVMAAHPAVADHIAEDVRAAKAVNEHLLPAYEALDVPADPKVDQALADLFAAGETTGKNPRDDAEADIVSFRPKPSPRSAATQPTWGLMAASIAALLAVGIGAYLYDSRIDRQREQEIASRDAEIQRITEERVTERDTLTRQVADLETRLGDMTVTRDEIATRLADADAEIDRLAADHANLAAELATTTDQADALRAERDKLETGIASLETQARQAAEEHVADRDALTRQLATLEADLSEAARARDEAATQLADAEATIGQLIESERDLSEQLTMAAGSADALQAERDNLKDQVASLDDNMRQLTEQAVTERDALTRQLASLQDSLGAVTGVRDDLTDQLADVETKLASVTTARDNAESEATTVKTELAVIRDDLAGVTLARNTAQARITAERELARQRVAALEEDLTDAREAVDSLNLRVARLNQTNDLLLAETEDLRKQNSWIAQVLGYHRGYADSMREVEVSAKAERDKQMLTKWFRDTFGRSFSIPELDGLTFVGGRVFFVNGVPTGQIAYHDEQGRLTGFCFTRGPEGQQIPVSEGRDDDLNIAYWLKGGWQYVMVGWADRRQLTPLAIQLQLTYGNDV